MKHNKIMLLLLFLALAETASATMLTQTQLAQASLNRDTILSAINRASNRSFLQVSIIESIGAKLGDDYYKPLTAQQVADTSNAVLQDNNSTAVVNVSDVTATGNTADADAIAAANAALQTNVDAARVELGSDKDTSKPDNNTFADELADLNAVANAEQKKQEALANLAALRTAGASQQDIAAAQAKVDALDVAGRRSKEINDIKAQIASFKTAVQNATDQAGFDELTSKWDNLSDAQKALIIAAAPDEIDELEQAINAKAGTLAAIAAANAALQANVDAARAELGKDTSETDNNTFADELADLNAVANAEQKKKDALANLAELIAAGATQQEIDDAQAKVDALKIADRRSKEINDIKGQIASFKTAVQNATSQTQLNDIKSKWNGLSDAQKDLINGAAQTEVNELLQAIAAKAETLPPPGTTNPPPPGTTNPAIQLPPAEDVKATLGAGATMVERTDGSKVIKSADESTVVTIKADGSRVVESGGLKLNAANGVVQIELPRGTVVPAANTVVAFKAAGLVTPREDGTYAIPGIARSFTPEEVTVIAANILTQVASSQSGGQVAETTANSVISNVGAALTSTASSFGSSSHGFSAVKKAMRGNDRMADRMPNVFNALAENGPVVMDVQKFRFWVSPYASISNLSGASEREKGFGALAGLTYRAAKYSVGFFFGYNTSKNEHNTLNKTAKTDSMTFGLNASANLWKDGIINFMYAYAPSTVNHEQKLGVMPVQSEKQKNHAHVIDVNVGHNFALGNAYALNLSLGNTSVFSKQGTYYGNVSELNGQSQEVYAGFGAAWNKAVQSGNAFVRASYQFGYQYKNSNKTPNIPLFGASNVVVNGVGVEKRKTHYVGLSTGMDLNKAWGFSFGYNGTYASKYQNHTVSGKIEYRM